MQQQQQQPMFNPVMQQQQQFGYAMQPQQQNYMYQQPQPMMYNVSDGFVPLLSHRDLIVMFILS